MEIYFQRRTDIQTNRQPYREKKCRQKDRLTEREADKPLVVKDTGHPNIVTMFDFYLFIYSSISSIKLGGLSSLRIGC